MRGGVGLGARTTSGRPRTAAAASSSPTTRGSSRPSSRSNIPFALSVAESADDPDDPESVVGREAEDFRVDSFDVSYGDPQTVAVVGQARARATSSSTTASTTARTQDRRRVRVARRRALRRRERALLRRVPRRGQRRPRRRPRQGLVQRREAGKHRWPRRRRRERAVHLHGQAATRAQGARARQRGLHGRQPDRTRPGTARRKYAAAHLARSARPATAPTCGTSTRRACRTTSACSATTRPSSGTWATTAITQDPEDLLIDTTPFGELPDIGVAERQQYLTMAVRDFLNEGGKLVHAGETGAVRRPARDQRLVGGLYYGLNGDPTAECVDHHRVQGFFDDCLILADDFRQYYLGAFTRVEPRRPGPRSAASRARSRATRRALGGTPSNPLDEAGVFQPTSEVLPVERVPAVREPGRGASTTSPAARSRPSRATRYAGGAARGRVLHAADQDGRPDRGRGGADAAAAVPALDQHRAGLRQRDRRGAHGRARTTGRRCPTSTAARTTDAAGRVHRPGLPARRCTRSCATTSAAPTARTHRHVRRPGTRSPGSTGGWQQVAFDLSAYAGKQVELSITLRDRPGHRRRRRVRGRHAVVVGGAHDAAGRLRGRDEHVDRPAARPRAARRTPATGRSAPQAVNFYAGTSTEDTLLLGLRPRAGHRRPPTARRWCAARSAASGCARAAPAAVLYRSTAASARSRASARPSRAAGGRRGPRPPRGGRGSLRRPAPALPCGITASIRRSEPPSAMSCLGEAELEQVVRVVRQPEVELGVLARVLRARLGVRVDARPRPRARRARPRPARSRAKRVCSSVMKYGCVPSERSSARSSIFGPSAAARRSSFGTASRRRRGRRRTRASPSAGACSRWSPRGGRCRSRAGSGPGSSAVIRACAAATSAGSCCQTLRMPVIDRQRARRPRGRAGPARRDGLPPIHSAP